MKPEKIIQAISRLEDYAIWILFLIIFLIGIYGMYDSYLVYQNADGDKLQRYKPTYQGSDEAPNDTDKQISGDMVAWLTIDDTSIDYPVMQGRTNSDYLNTDPFGEYSLSGSIFLDYRNAAGFDDGFSLIYGHHMDEGYMFGALDDYKEEGYLETHRTGTIIIDEKMHRFTLYAVLEADANERAIFAPSEVSPEESRRYIRENAKYYIDNADTAGKQIIALSTCQSPSNIRRTIVTGVMD